RRERERQREEESDRKRDQKQKYNTLCLSLLNKTTSAVSKCMKEDDDEERLKAIFEGLGELLGRIGIDTNEAATRKERPKKRQGQRGDSLLERETRSDIR
ncbi:hypothetical protein PENTCL1PPCAC_5794, partial [Pristionchus entomophagus]